MADRPRHPRRPRKGAQAGRHRPDERFIISKNGDDIYAFPEANLGSFARRYGQTNPVEDFATTFELFITNPAELQRRSPDKFAFMTAFAA